MLIGIPLLQSSTTLLCIYLLYRNWLKYTSDYFSVYIYEFNEIQWDTSLFGKTREDRPLLPSTLWWNNKELYKYRYMYLILLNFIKSNNKTLWIMGHISLHFAKNSQRISTHSINHYIISDFLKIISCV